MSLLNTQLTPDALAVITLRNFYYVIIGCYKLDTVDFWNIGCILYYIKILLGYRLYYIKQ